MKKNIAFLIKLVLLSVILFLFAFKIVMPQYTGFYNAGLIDKCATAEAINEPKIVIVGDSNVAFGFDCSLIEKAFDMPVVNFGVQGSLGLAFHADILKSYVSSGDIIVFAPCNYQVSPDIADPVIAWITVENNIGMLKNLSFSNIKSMVKAYPTYFKRALNLWVDAKGNETITDNAYSRLAFNEYGDIAFPRSECILRDGNYGAYFYSVELLPEMRDYLNDYAAFAKENGISVYMSCPPVFEPTLKSLESLNTLQQQLEKELEFPVISRLEDYVYPMEMFYDTGLHLNDKGKVLRTNQLIEDLTEYIK